MVTPLHPTEKGRVRNIAVLLMVCMITASIVIKMVEDRFDIHAPELTLRDQASESGTALFVVEGRPYIRYLRSSVGVIYDGNYWQLQKATETDCLGSISDETQLLIPKGECISWSHRDFNKDILSDLPVIGDPQYLQLPGNITQRVRDLSARITDGESTPFGKARAIEKYLQGSYDYDRNYAPAPPDWEPIDWFLFEAKQGVCGNFNSAFVILARVSGIPARLSIGYFIPPGEGEPQPVYAGQSHAWAEVGFKELGWIAFEATPP